MKFIDILSTASSNMLRSKVRSILTVVAVFVGALTLTLTVGISSGISSYVDDQLGNLGADDVLMVQMQLDMGFGDSSSGPKEYDPNRTLSSSDQSGMAVAVLTDEDIDIIRGEPGIKSVEPTLVAAVDYIQAENQEKYQINASSFITGTNLSMAAGKPVANDSSQKQIVLPISYISALGFSSNKNALGQPITLGITDATGVQHRIEAIIVGVQEQTLVSAFGANVNTVLIENLHDVQSQGLPDSAKDRYQDVIARLDKNISDKDLQTIKDDLKAKGYSALTLKDQIGAFKQVIGAIAYVLIFFGGIALLAASFGIINTLFMAVQERTKEIGLMKAVGMSGGKIFTLFSVEAVLLGFWGSLTGVLAAMGLGQIANRFATDTFLKDLEGFALTSFPLQSVVIIVMLITGIAFLAGTLPARRAARQNPIDALRYE